MSPKETGIIIAQKRKEKGLNQTQLAQILCVSNRTVSKWENGDGYPDITMLPAISKALGITIDALLTTGDRQSFSEENSPDKTELTDETGWKSRFSVLKVIAFTLAAIAAVIGSATEVFFLKYLPFGYKSETIIVLISALLLITGVLLYTTALAKYKYRSRNLVWDCAMQSYAITLLALLFPVVFIFRMTQWSHYYVGYDIDIIQGFGLDLFGWVAILFYISAAVVSFVVIKKKQRTHMKNDTQ